MAKEKGKAMGATRGAPKGVSRGSSKPASEGSSKGASGHASKGATTRAPQGAATAKPNAKKAAVSEARAKGNAGARGGAVGAGAGGRRNRDAHARAHAGSGTRALNAGIAVQGASAPAGAVCAHAAQCGACSCVNLPYGEQLKLKDSALRDIFAACVPSIDRGNILLPTMGMDDPFHYRNKVISPFAPGRKGGILTGMYAAGTHTLVDTAGCPVENVQANAVVQAVRDIMVRHGMEPYDEDSGTGFIRHVVVRAAHRTEELLVTVVTNGEEFPASRGFAHELVRRCPFVTTIVQNVNTRMTNVILGEKERTLYGPGFILDELCGLSFRISSRSFYQVNAVQTEVLYDEAVRAAGLTGTETVIDAYCGTGTIGLVAASRGAARVVGVESVESAVRDARQNAKHNGIRNAEFVCADATEFMRERAAEPSISHPPAGSSDGATVSGAEGGLVLMMDPPRAGSTPEFLQAVAALAPSRIVYISCNPRTQVRDIALLQTCGYVVQRIQPVDMFPHTPHVETVALLVHG